jgi:hypothetical protein
MVVGFYFVELVAWEDIVVEVVDNAGLGAATMVVENGGGE